MNLQQLKNAISLIASENEKSGYLPKKVIKISRQFAALENAISDIKNRYYVKEKIELYSSLNAFRDALHKVEGRKVDKKIQQIDPRLAVGFLKLIYQENTRKGMDQLGLEIKKLYDLFEPKIVKSLKLPSIEFVPDDQWEKHVKENLEKGLLKKTILFKNKKAYEENIQVRNYIKRQRYESLILDPTLKLIARPPKRKKYKFTDTQLGLWNLK